MPHTNRRKKGPGTNGPHEKKPQSTLHAPTKRILVDDEEGWTHVIDTPQSRRRGKGAEKIPKGGSVIHAGDWQRDGVAYINMSLEDMKKEYAVGERQWTNSEGYKALRRVFLDNEDGLTGKEQDARKERLPVDNAVCLGLGSFQRASREGRKNSFIQLAALASILQWLGSHKPISCVFQDPQFTDADKAFLTTLDYKVMDDPQAFEHVNANTLVYAIHCYEKVYKNLSAGPKPALLIGTDVDKFGMFDVNFEEKTSSTALEDMVRDCETLGFPRYGFSFSDTKMYWRKEGSSMP